MKVIKTGDIFPSHPDLDQRLSRSVSSRVLGTVKSKLGDLISSQLSEMKVDARMYMEYELHERFGLEKTDGHAFMFVDLTVDSRQTRTEGEFQFSGYLYSPETARVILKSVPAARRSALMLLEGSEGVGKKTLAKSIQQSLFPNGKFLAIDCHTQTEESFASLLREVCSTVATSTDGNKATLYLEDAEGLSRVNQKALLKFTEDQSTPRFRDIPENSPNPWVVASCRRKLHDFVVQGKFDKGLYDLLSVTRFHLPSLHEETSAILPLFVSFFNGCFVTTPIPSVPKSRAVFQEPVKIEDSVREELLSYRWPGNVGELRKLAERCYTAVKDRSQHVTASLVRELIAELAAETVTDSSTDLTASNTYAIEKPKKHSKGLDVWWDKYLKLRTSTGWKTENEEIGDKAKAYCCTMKSEQVDLSDKLETEYRGDLKRILVKRRVFIGMSKVEPDLNQRLYRMKLLNENDLTDERGPDYGTFKYHYDSAGMTVSVAKIPSADGLLEEEVKWLDEFVP